MNSKRSTPHASASNTASKSKPSRRPEVDPGTVRLTQEAIWADRVTKELQTQRSWAAKWGCLSDPSMYRDTSTPLTRIHDGYKRRTGDSRIIYAPFNEDRPITPRTEKMLPTYKITGGRRNFMSAKSPQEQHQYRPRTAAACPTPRDTFNPYLHPSTSHLLKSQLRAMPSHLDETYSYPQSTNTEYGWRWARRRDIKDEKGRSISDLEVYGSTSARRI